MFFIVALIFTSHVCLFVYIDPRIGKKYTTFCLSYKRKPVKNYFI